MRYLWKDVIERIPDPKFQGSFHVLKYTKKRFIVKNYNPAKPNDKYQIEQSNIVDNEKQINALKAYIEFVDNSKIIKWNQKTYLDDWKDKIFIL